MLISVRAYTLSECMDKTAEYVERFEKQGEKNILFCEDRLTLVAERAILRRLGGSFSSSVTTFARFFKPSGQTVSKQGSIMATGAILNKLLAENKLKRFRFQGGGNGTAKCIYETLAQLSSSGVDSAMLKENGALLEDGILKDKVSDLALVYDEYETFLQGGEYIDESRYLSLLPESIETSKETENANVFFLCYNSFTKQASRAIEAACKRAKNVVGIFCGGEEDFYLNRAEETFCSVCEKFGKVEKVFAGIPLFAEAETVRQSLFCPETFEEGRKRVPTENVKIFEAQDETGEAEYVAMQVRKLLAENKTLRYRDIAVLVSDVARYSSPIKQVLEEYRIPYFIDEKKSLKNHPLGAFILSAFAVVRENFSPRSVQKFLSSPFFGDGDEYRNYLLKYGAYRGAAKKEIKSEETLKSYQKWGVDALKKRLEKDRERLLSITQKIPKKATGEKFCQAVRALLEDDAIVSRLTRLVAETEDVAVRSYLEQIETTLPTLLDEAERLLFKSEMTCTEFERVLSDGLESAEISLIPLKSDAVFVGDITDSRIEKVSALFCLGMTDDVPKSAEDTALISDRDIEKLADVKTKIEPTVAEVNLRSRECVALNLCTFQEKLFLTYSGKNGDETTPSEILRYMGVFGEKDGERLKTQKSYTDEEFCYLCSAPAPAIRQAVIERSNYEDRFSYDTKRFSSVYSALQKIGAIVPEAERADGNETERWSVSCGEALFFTNGTVSPTSLEGYFSCPFQNFLSRGLRLKEREETVVLATDSGTFIHELLRRAGEKKFAFSSEEEARAFAKETGELILKDAKYNPVLDTAGGKYASERLIGEGVLAVAAAYRQIAGSKYTVKEAEYSVKDENVHGQIDRVDTADEYFRIVDYKTGAIDASATSYYMGRKIQLELYATAVKSAGKCAGVYYFPASLSYKEAKDQKPFQMSGFMDETPDALRAGDLMIDEKEESDFFNGELKGKSRKENMLSEEDFAWFLRYAVLVANKGKEEMKKGFVAPTPYDKSCEYCSYAGICGRKPSEVGRKEKAIKAAEIASIVSEEEGGTHDGK